MRTSDFLKTSEGSKYLLCDGSDIPSAYSKLRTLMSHTPDLRDRIPQGAGVYEINKKIEAALPNIYGHFSAQNVNLVGPTGAFYQISYSSNTLYGAGVTKGANEHCYIDASLCSSIYKNSCTTVQPPALTVNFYIKAK